jgi:hypothetical protein
MHCVSHLLHLDELFSNRSTTTPIGRTVTEHEATQQHANRARTSAHTWAHAAATRTRCSLRGCQQNARLHHCLS